VKNDFHSHPSNDETWRIFRIMAEFVDGFEMLSRVGPCITIFGSARTAVDSEYYNLAKEIARIAVKNGYGVITGGGPGIMEAANRGAAEANGVSIGLNIQLPFEQMPNKFIKTLINFRYFFCRKVMFLKYTQAVIVLPGGFGTMDEAFETLTLLQTGRIESIPFYFAGSEFWKGLISWVDKEMRGRNYIQAPDVELMKICDDPVEIIEKVNEFRKSVDRKVNFA
jgi:uncharacterized protein (TIGR00730 family)